MTEENEVSLELVGSQPPPKQMRDLDFLLGSISCVVNTGTKMTIEIRSVLGGNYFDCRVAVDRENGQQVNGVFALGWNAADKVFSNYYYDDARMQGTSTSPGWRDGTLTFQGRYTLGEDHAEIRTLFERLDEDHFIVRELALREDEWKLLDIQDCHRTPLE
jgi:hypothetical protein